MPQELHVVRCCICEAFQVDIVKKIPKWICKMCGEKQSLKKVYGKGTGIECRRFVQDLNEQRLTLQKGRLVENFNTNQNCGSELSDYTPTQDNIDDLVNDYDGDNIEKPNTKKFKLDDNNRSTNLSKWDTFLRSDVALNDVNHENNHCNTSVVKSDDAKFESESRNRIILENITSTTDYNNKFGDASNLDLDLAF